MKIEHLCGGELVTGQGEVVECISPHDGSVWNEGSTVGIDAVEKVVAAANAAMPAAAATTVEERAAALRMLADLLEDEQDFLAETITLENGCPSAQSKSLQVLSAAALLRAQEHLTEIHVFREKRNGMRGGDVFIHKHPVGVSVGIVPWNVPIFLSCMKLGQAIAAGCPVILKPSPENITSMARFANIAARLPLPAGMVSVLNGGRELGAALVAHPAVAKVSFTGSTRAGIEVAQSCAARLARCTLELGGKSAGILLDDFELDAFEAPLFKAMLQNNGQVCGAQTRILVPRSRLGDLTEQLSDFFNKLKVGPGKQVETQIGPVATKSQQSRVLGCVRRAKQEGAIYLGGASYADAPEGACFAPAALFRCDDPNLTLVREEVFGPVIALIPYENEDQAILLANDNDYGLSGSVWSPDRDRAKKVAERLRTGTVGINTSNILDFGAPFGGFRRSGIGRELGPEGIDAYLETSATLT